MASMIIVETARGIEYGEVVGKIKEINEEELSAPLKPIYKSGYSRR